MLIENAGAGGSINHLGIEVDTTDEVVDATRRFTAAALPTDLEGGTTCCYALQNKVWVTGPGGERWEIYTVLADAGSELEGNALADVGILPAEATSPAAPGSQACCAS